MKITSLFSGLLMLWVFTAGADSFEHEYLAADGHTPQHAIPAWALQHGGGIIELQEDHLTAETPVGERNFFVIGMLDDEKNHGDSDTWDAAGGATTVEFRVRCESDEPGLEIFHVHISTGALQWRIRFLGDKIFPRGVSLNTNEADTYRAVIKHDKLTLSSERQGVILRDVAGNESYAGKPTRSNAILFGSFAPNSQASGGKTVWELEFIRWTNQEALPDL